MHLSDETIDRRIELSRRKAERIIAKAMDLIFQDYEEINIEWPQIVALAGLAADSIYKKTS